MNEDIVTYKQGWLPNAFSLTINESQKREAVRWCTFNVEPKSWIAKKPAEEDILNPKKVFYFEHEGDRDEFALLFGS